MTDPLSTVESLPLQIPEESGPVPEHRMLSYASGKSIYDRLLKEDSESRAKRAKVQAMLDGETPYDEAVLISTGQGSRCNLNFDEGGSLHEQAMTGYVDLFNAVESLVHVSCTYGEPTERHEYSSIISEEITGLIRRWPKFMFNHLKLSSQFVDHGVGGVFFMDSMSWKWHVGKWGDFLLPRRTEATEEDVDLVLVTKTYTVTELFRHIRDEDAAEKAGWNVDAVRKALVAAARDQSGNNAQGYNWERLQEDVKNNDVGVSVCSDSIKVVNFYIKEFDGTLSHYIGLENGEGDSFLYESHRRFKKINEAVVIFTYGIGNGFFSGIRGLGDKIYPHIQVSNRLQCQAVDGSMMAASVMLQPENPAAVEDMALMNYGPFTILSPGMNVVKERVSPNFAQNVMPMVEDMRNQIRSKSGQYNPSGVFGDQREKTRFELAAHLDSLSKLSATTLNLWYEAWDKVIREVTRRVTSKNYPKSWDGGEEVHEFRRKCVARGVPEEAIYTLDHTETKAVRALGAGSEAERSAIIDDLEGVSHQFDPQGQMNFLRDKVATRVGYSAADRYVQKANMPGRPPVDAKIAQLENGQMKTGVEIQVQPNELHFVHLEEHVYALTEFAEKLESGEVELEQAAVPMAIIHTHAVTHLQSVEGDPQMAQEVDMFQQVLQQLGEFVHNGMRALNKQKRDQQEGQEEPGKGGVTPAAEEAAQRVELKFQEHKLKLQMMVENHQAKLHMKALEHAESMRLKHEKESFDVREFLRR